MGEIRLITLKRTNNQPAKSEVTDSIKLICDALKPKVTQNAVLIFSTKHDCIDCSWALSENLKNIIEFIPLLNFFNFQFENQGHQFIIEKRITHNIYSEYYLMEPYEPFFQDIKKLAENAWVLILTDEDWQEKFDKYCTNKRDFNHAFLSIFNIPDENPELKEVPEINEKEVFDYVINDLEEGFRQKVYQQRMNQLEIISDLMKKNFQYAQANDKIFKSVTESKSSEGEISHFDFMTIEEYSNNIKEKVEKVAELISIFDDLSSTYSDSGKKHQDNKLVIDRFYYSEDIGKWRLRIVNNTDFDFRNISILIAENKKILTKLTIVQHNCTIWKEIEGKYNHDIFGNHLVAICQSNIVSEIPYLISPCKISVIQEIEEGDDLTLDIALKNFSYLEFNSICLAVPGVIQDYNFENPSVKYMQKTYITVQLKKRPELTFFAYSYDKKITPDIVIRKEIV